MEAAAASGSRGSSHQDSNSFLGAYRRPQQHQAAKCMGVCARCAGGRVHGCAGCPVVCCRLQPRGRQMGLRLADSLGGGDANLGPGVAASPGYCPRHPILAQPPDHPRRSQAPPRYGQMHPLLAQPPDLPDYPRQPQLIPGGKHLQGTMCGGRKVHVQGSNGWVEVVIISRPTAWHSDANS
eukprot:1161295-Pelagomonas_calceolata.AAC.2